MREILFTGKDIRGNWHFGLLAHIGNAWYISNSAGVATAYEVIPDTIGQYTGFKDKNGHRIFENDIIEAVSHDYYGDNFVGVVVFKQGCWQIEYTRFRGERDEHKAYHRLGKKHRWNDGQASGDMNYKYKKICTLSDNPAELLKGGAY